jgi:hypothetical protein
MTHLALHVKYKVLLKPYSRGFLDFSPKSPQKQGVTIALLISIANSFKKALRTIDH